jgi:hypothetical protein
MANMHASMLASVFEGIPFLSLSLFLGLWCTNLVHYLKGLARWRGGRELGFGSSHGLMNAPRPCGAGAWQYDQLRIALKESEKGKTSSRVPSGRFGAWGSSPTNRRKLPPHHHTTTSKCM